MSIERFEQLEVWQQSHALVLWVYATTSKLPADERFGLVSQMRRAAISIPANIAEGFKRRGAKEKCRFYNISQGSLEELRYFIILCRDLGYKVDEPHFTNRANQIGRMLTGLIRSLKDK
jgi:four helix bundle protein